MGAILKNLEESGWLGGKPDKNELIRKLKTVRDPRERDRILYLLAGQEPPVSDQPRFNPETGPASKAPASILFPQQPPKQDVPPASESDTPAAPVKGLGVLIGAILPVFFLLIGFILIVTSIEDIKEGRNPKNMMTGGMFIFFGLIGLYKLKKGKQRSKEF